jgi:hypothetical protein
MKVAKFEVKKKYQKKVIEELIDEKRMKIDLIEDIEQNENEQIEY